MSLRDDPIFQDYDALLTEREKEMHEYLLSGKAKDMPDYKRIVGILRGMAIARELLDEAIKLYMEND